MDKKTKKILIIVPLAIIAMVGGVAMAAYHIPFILVVIAFIAIGIVTGKIKVTGNYSAKHLSPEEAASLPKGLSYKFTTTTSTRLPEGANISENLKDFIQDPPTITIGNNASPEDNLKSYAYIAYGMEWPVALYALPFSFLPQAPFGGLMLALMNRKKAAGTIYESHFNWIVRTYCISMIVGVLLLIPGLMGFVALTSHTIINATVTTTLGGTWLCCING